MLEWHHLHLYGPQIPQMQIQEASLQPKRCREEEVHHFYSTIKQLTEINTLKPSDEQLLIFSFPNSFFDGGPKERNIGPHDKHKKDGKIKFKN